MALERIAGLLLLAMRSWIARAASACLRHGFIDPKPTFPGESA